MPITAKVLVDGVALTGTIATYYTVPVSTKTRLLNIHLSNNHTVPVTVDIYLIPSGGVAGNANHMFIADSTNGIVLASKESRTIPIDTLADAGATLQMLASVAAVIGCRVWGYEIVG